VTTGNGRAASLLEADGGFGPVPNTLAQPRRRNERPCSTGGAKRSGPSRTHLVLFDSLIVIKCCICTTAIITEQLPKASLPIRTSEQTMPLNKAMYDANEIYRSWVDNPLRIIEPSEINNNSGFRKPQRAALYSALGHLTSSANRPATVVMPTGTGKTDTIFALVIAGTFPRTLIIVPSDALRTQTSEKITALSNIRRFNSIGEETL
jgi:hypothetical protein